MRRRYLLMLALIAFYQCLDIVTAQIVDIPLALNKIRLPIVTLCDQYSLLLDTGSKQTWIADLTCINCPKTIGLCPHLHENKQKIEYFKGSVKGDIVYRNDCFGSEKIVCVRQAQGMDNLMAMGILGVKGRSTGRSSLVNMFVKHQIAELSFTIYYGLQEARLILGQIPLKYRLKELQIQKSQHQQWQIDIHKVYINQQQIYSQKIHIFFDTGSNLLILPTIIYQQILKIIKQTMNTYGSGCWLIKQRPLSMKCQHPQFFDQNLSFSINQNDENNKLVILMKDLLIRTDEYTYILTIDQNPTQQKQIIVGVSLLSKYLIQFHLEGSLRIYLSNSEELSNSEVFNLKMMLCQYVVMIVALAFLSIKIYAVIDETINRKIVI